MCEVGHQKLPVHHRRDKKGCEDEDAARIVAELRESTDRGGHVGDVVENVAAENEVDSFGELPQVADVEDAVPRRWSRSVLVNKNASGARSTFDRE